MTEVLLFHHAQGLTDGCRAFAARLGAAGHHVHAPDLYEGRTFPDLTAGVAYAGETGFDTIIDRGRKAAEGPAEIVYVGLSLGALPAQMLAQTRTGALGAALVSAAVPPSEFGGPWQATPFPLQIHMMDADPVVTDDGDLDVAREITEQADHASLYLYRGDRHLFVDDTLLDYDHAATELVVERIVDMLGRVG